MFKVFERLAPQGQPFAVRAYRKDHEERKGKRDCSMGTQVSLTPLTPPTDHFIVPLRVLGAFVVKRFRCFPADSGGLGQASREWRTSAGKSNYLPEPLLKSSSPQVLNLLSPDSIPGTPSDLPGS